MSASPASPESQNSSSEKKKPVREMETARETIESIVFAFVLAFLFRTFEAEAFVIPTGSMAPTLFGRHKDVQCDQCGYEFQFGASQEVERDVNLLRDGYRIRQAVCPNCRFSNTKAYNAPAYKGDRILVNKFQYELHAPKRFDVVVFKYPGDPKTNYIKRLIGLPGETIRIHNGNVYKLDANNKEVILRKENPEKQKKIQIPVYDDTYPETALREAGWPSRWASVSKSAAKDFNTVNGWGESKEGWQPDSENHSYTLAQNSKTHWLRYRHFAPTQRQWDRLANGDELEPRARLIGDFCGYNAFSTEMTPIGQKEFFWVGDLTLSGKLSIEKIEPGADIILELTEGFHLYRCHLDPTSGNARLVRVDESLDSEEEIELASASTNLQAKGEYTFRFANVDDRLCLWIDDQFIEFGPEASYVSSEVNGTLPQETDLSPVGIAMSGVAGTVSSLLIERDIYYQGSRDYGPMALDNLIDWQNTYRNHRKNWDMSEFKIPEGRFFVLGDNSPESSDGRFWQAESHDPMWEETSTVPREAFVGKAFYIYWPHGIPMGVEQGWAWPISYHKRHNRVGTVVKEKEYPLHYIPFAPNFSRMKRIR